MPEIRELYSLQIMYLGSLPDDIHEKALSRGTSILCAMAISTYNTTSLSFWHMLFVDR